MFDLNREVGKWRSDLRKAGLIRRDAGDELESHLWDEIDRLTASGLNPEEAFLRAVDRLGTADNLSEEFSKDPRWGSGLLELTGGEVMAMGLRSLNRNEHFITLLLFVGISGVAGWIVTTWWMLANGTNSGHWATWPVALRTIGMFSLWTSFFMIPALACLPWGGVLLRRCENKKRVLARALIPAIVLMPVYAFMGFMMILFGPYLYACGSAMINGPNVVQSVVSPDGAFEAYVVDSPSIDGPNQSLYIDRSDGIHFLNVAGLAEDIDSIESIHWSPQSDIVVFKSYRNLFAVCLPSFKTVQIPFGAEWRRTARQRGSTFTSGGLRYHVGNIAFPEAGVVTYEIEETKEVKRLDLAGFLR